MSVAQPSGSKHVETADLHSILLGRWEQIKHGKMQQWCRLSLKEEILCVPPWCWHFWSWELQQVHIRGYPHSIQWDTLHPLLISSTNIYTIPMKVRRLGEGIFLKIHFTRSYLPGWIGPNSAEWLFSQENWWPTPTKCIEMLRIHTLLLLLGPATWAKFSGWIWYKVHQFLTPKTQASTMFLTEVETRINYTRNAWGWILPAPQTSPDQILYFEKIDEITSSWLNELDKINGISRASVWRGITCRAPMSQQWLGATGQGGGYSFWNESSPLVFQWTETSALNAK